MHDSCRTWIQPSSKRKKSPKGKILAGGFVRHSHCTTLAPFPLQTQHGCFSTSVATPNSIPNADNRSQCADPTTPSADPAPTANTRILPFSLAYLWCVCAKMGRLLDVLERAAVLMHARVGQSIEPNCNETTTVIRCV